MSKIEIEIEEKEELLLLLVERERQKFHENDVLEGKKRDRENVCVYCACEREK